MKKIYDFLGIYIGVSVGIFLGHSIYTFGEYKALPDLYAMQSAPWYTSILVRGFFTVVTVAIVMLIRRVLRKKIEGNTTNG